MRVALIGPVYPYRGGIAHYTTMLHRALCEREHEVLLVSFKRQYPKWLFPGQSDQDPSKRPLKAKEAKYWIDSLNPLTWLIAFRRIRLYRPDVIILQWWTTFWAPAWFVFGLLNRLFLRESLIYICHNVLPHETKFWDSRLVRLVLAWGTHFTVQSTSERERLVAMLPRANVVVSPLPVFDMFADGKISKAEARRQLGMPIDVPILLFFGIVREYKGLKDVLRALPVIQGRQGKVLLLVAGEFWEDKQPYLKIVEQLDIGGSVIIEDRYIPNEQVPLYFSAADILVAPYRRVTGSAAIQMAFGFECPVVATAIDGLMDLGHEHNDLMLVPPADSDALAAAIVRYFTHVQAVSSSGHSEKRAFTWSSLVDIIESLVTEKSHSSP
jgi:glycosyltransferase involved in cell wall biosynthesis